jgi:putative transposase
LARSSFYAWRQRQEFSVKGVAENPAITTEIMVMFQEHLGFFGSPRIHQELWALGRHVGRLRVARLMRRAQFGARIPKAFRPSSRESRGAVGVVENLLQ